MNYIGGNDYSTLLNDWSCAVSTALEQFLGKNKSEASIEHVEDSLYIKANMSLRLNLKQYNSDMKAAFKVVKSAIDEDINNESDQKADYERTYLKSLNNVLVEWEKKAILSMEEVPGLKWSEMANQMNLYSILLLQKFNVVHELSPLEM